MKMAVSPLLATAQPLTAPAIPVTHDVELYNTAAELTKLMGHKNPDRFFCDPTAVDPRTGQLRHPAPQPPAPPPDPKLLALQARAQADQAAAAHKAQAEQQKAQNDSIHQQVKAQAAIELAKVRAELDARMKLLDAHLEATAKTQKIHDAPPQSDACCEACAGHDGDGVQP